MRRHCEGASTTPIPLQAAGIAVATRVYRPIDRDHRGGGGRDPHPALRSAGRKRGAGPHGRSGTRDHDPAFRGDRDPERLYRWEGRDGRAGRLRDASYALRQDLPRSDSFWQQGHDATRLPSPREAFPPGQGGRDDDLRPRDRPDHGDHDGQLQPVPVQEATRQRLLRRRAPTMDVVGLPRSSMFISRLFAGWADNIEDSLNV